MSGNEKAIGEPQKSLSSVVRSAGAEDSGCSTGGRRLGKRLNDVLDVPGPGDRFLLDDGREFVLEIEELGANQLSGVKSWPSLIVDEVLPLFLLLDRTSCLRQTRFVATYSQVRSRFAQREHVGFSLRHFSLEDAQAWQLSRNLGAAGSVGRRLTDNEGGANLGDCDVVMLYA